MARTPHQYDIIMLDAYFTDAMPFHLTTKQFFELAQKKLTPNGIIVANLISAVTGPSGKIARAFVRTQRQVFPQTYVFAARRADNVSLDTIQNVIVVATRDKQRVDIKEIVKRAMSIDKGLFPDPIQDIAIAYFDRPCPKMFRYSPMITRQRITCLILSALLFSSCSLLGPDTPQRVVRVKVFADIPFRARNPNWIEEARGLVEAASDYYEREFAIRIMTQSVSAWPATQRVDATPALAFHAPKGVSHRIEGREL